MAEPSHRDQARDRYGHRCGYCGVHERDAGAMLTIDHHRPRKHGGADDEANLVYCCPRCNEHEGSYWHETDPPHVRLLHPAHDALAAHLREGDAGDLVSSTPEGEFFIARLRLNRSPLIAYRLAGRAERQVRAELDAARSRIEELEKRIAALAAEVDSVAEDIQLEGA